MPRPPNTVGSEQDGLLVELQTVFRRRLGDVFRSGYGLRILVLNAAFGTLTYAVVRLIFGIAEGMGWAALIGASFAAVLRSPVTFNFSFNDDDKTKPLKASAFALLSQLYEGLLRDAIDAADAFQADRRTQVAEQLADKYTAAFLENEVSGIINQLVVEDRRKAAEEKPKVALDVVDDRQKRKMLASLLQVFAPGCPAANSAISIAPLSPCCRVRERPLAPI